MTKSNSPSASPSSSAEAKPALSSPRSAGTNSGRSVPEWIGSSPDARIPPRVRARVFLKHGGICYLTKRRIMPRDHWECDHIVALINGGEHRENNLAPALRDAHRIKTREDVKQKAKVDRLRKRHMGIKKPRTITGWRNFKQEVVRVGRER